MMHDIFATSMGGSYETRAGEELIERGSWNYRGYGNAEIAMDADGELVRSQDRYAIKLHSVERQVDDITLTTWNDQDAARKLVIHAVVAGHDISVSVSDGDDDVKEGNISVPDETIYDGPSPLWVVHLMMVSMVPEDQVITTPFVRFGLTADDVRGGFYQVERKGPLVTFTALDTDGSSQGRVEIDLADDGVPMVIRDGDFRTEIIRIPQVAGL